MVELYLLAFRNGVLPKEVAWQAVVLITNGVWNYRVIGFVEVVWKAVAVILNCRFTAAIVYHDFLH